MTEAGGGQDGCVTPGAFEPTDRRPLTCRDLAVAGIPGFEHHDAEHQSCAEEYHCFCWVEAGGEREYGESFLPSELESQRCHGPRLAFGRVALNLCCRCTDAYPGTWTELQAEVLELVETGDLEIPA